MTKPDPNDRMTQQQRDQAIRRAVQTDPYAAPILNCDWFLRARLIGSTDALDITIDAAESEDH